MIKRAGPLAGALPAPIALTVAALAGWGTGNMGMKSGVAITPGLVHVMMPSWVEVWRSFQLALLPQLSLTLTNAVLVTTRLARELFPASREDRQ